MRFDPLGVFRVLDDHGVEYVVIGGVAAAALGSPSVTVDVDICYRRSDANLRRLADALRAVNARLRGVDEDVPFILDATALAAGDHFTLTTDLGDLDLFGVPAGTAGYDQLLANSVQLDVGSAVVRVASIDDLIRMKKAAGRPKDLIELEVLGALRAEVEDRSPERS